MFEKHRVLQMPSPNSCLVFCESTSIPCGKIMDVLPDQCGALVQRVLECGFGCSPSAVCYWSLQDKFRIFGWIAPFLHRPLPLSTYDRRCWFVLSRGHHLGQLDLRRGVCHVGSMQSCLFAADVWETSSSTDAKPQLMPRVLWIHQHPMWKNYGCIAWPVRGLSPTSLGMWFWMLSFGCMLLKFAGQI